MVGKDEYIAQLFPEISEIRDNKLRGGVLSAWRRAMELGGWEVIEGLPFTFLIPNVTESLVAHVRIVTQMCLKVAELVAISDRHLVNRDYLLAGALLHDVGKLIECERKGNELKKSRKGDFLRHPFIGACLALECNLPYEVAHIIATHSHEGDCGKRSCESLIVHYCDFTHFDLMKNKYSK